MKANAKPRLKKIVGIILGSDPNDINDDDLLSDLGMDSLDMLDMAYDIDEEFDVDFSMVADFETLTINSIAQSIIALSLESACESSQSK